jgi:hypothetical protein
MEESSLVRLYLREPIAYDEVPGLVPFERTFSMDTALQECLFCFEINREQAQRIDPEADCFLGELVFAGKINGGHGRIQLPCGMYLFLQQRRLLGREECLHFAIEQQMEGLWQRIKPENRLYIRFLFEDDSPVTQILRPCSD